VKETEENRHSREGEGFGDKKSWGERYKVATVIQEPTQFCGGGGGRTSSSSSSLEVGEKVGEVQRE